VIRRPAKQPAACGFNPVPGLPVRAEEKRGPKPAL